MVNTIPNENGKNIMVCNVKRNGERRWKFHGILRRTNNLSDTEHNSIICTENKKIHPSAGSAMMHILIAI